MPAPTRPDARPHPDASGRLLALLVFLAGVGILVFVFVIALHLFQSPVPGLEPLQTAGAAPPPAANIGTALADFARRLLLLGVMTLIGSLLASRGAHLYFGLAATPQSPEATGAAEEPAGKSPEKSPEKSTTSGK